MVPFVLLSHARTGSTFVALSLAAHPNVRMFGELFNDEEEERARAFRGEKAAHKSICLGYKYPSYCRKDMDGGQFVRDHIFRVREATVFSVGFKLFYDQAAGHSGEGTVWKYIVENKDIHIIHLLRNNLLESWVSLQTALLTDEWVREPGIGSLASPMFPLELDLASTEGFFDHITSRVRWAQSTLGDHPKIEISYEHDLCNDFEMTMHRLHDFLGLPRVAVTKALEKQAFESLRERIINYDVLARFFRSTRYEGFFA